MRYPIRSALITIITGGLLGSGAALAESNACKADISKDGVVNFVDLAVLKSAFFQRCSGPTCGDGLAQGPTEQCDDGNLVNGDGCSSACMIEVPLPVVCGDGIAQGPTEQCDDGNLSEGDGCSSICTIEGPLPSVCGDGMAVMPEQCDDGNVLDGDGCSRTCEIAPVFTSGFFPATGQTKCWNNGGSVIPCGGTGHDGEIQAGATLAYVDNGDGTITDTNTGLVWEKLDDNNVGGIHDLDNAYTWDDAFSVKIAALNAGRFAGHGDWRVPNIKELQSIVNYQNLSPAVSAAFNTGCMPGCTVTSCSCTQSNRYWSSSSDASFPSYALNEFFSRGFDDRDQKANGYYVRAVRGGPP